MARVRSVFQRAGQPEDGKAGDGALELHEFLEAVVQLSFSRANPRCGEAGHENDAPAHPLPGCLEQMLTQNLLRKAKQDALVKIKKMASKEPAVLAVLRPLRSRLKKRFVQLLARGATRISSARGRRRCRSRCSAPTCSTGASPGR